MRATWILAATLIACGVATDRNMGGNDGGDGDTGAGGGDGGDGSGSGSGSGSGGGDTSTPFYKSGTRIKMRMLTSPDGAKVFRGNFDAQRNEPCDFQVASDGTMRCLPADSSYSSFFADSACTVPAAVLPACDQPLKYISKPVTMGCSTRLQIFPASAGVAGAFYSLSGTVCQQSMLPGYLVFAATGPEIPPSSFQSATLAVE